MYKTLVFKYSARFQAFINRRVQVVGTGSRDHCVRSYMRLPNRVRLSQIQQPTTLTRIYIFNT